MLTYMYIITGSSIPEYCDGGDDIMYKQKNTALQAATLRWGQGMLIMMT